MADVDVVETAQAGKDAAAIFPDGNDGAADIQIEAPRAVHRPRWHGYTAFVLSGGGARGALQVGALQALFEAGVRPDVVVGTSIGAWNGALIAKNPTLDGVAAAREAWMSAHPTRVLLGIEPPASSPAQAHATMRMLVAARRVAAGEASLYGDTGVRQFLDRLIGDATFEQTVIPLRVVATDITHSTRMVFGSGPIAPAVLASSAIPGVFPPVRLGDTVYVDGGALDNASVETALELGARRIYVLEVGYDERSVGAALWAGEDVAPRANGRHGRNGRKPSIHPLAALLERTSQVQSHYQLERALSRVPPGVELHVVRVGQEAGGGALEFEKAPAWIEEGYEITKAYLERATSVRAPRAAATLA
jgi:NTE family protein